MNAIFVSKNAKEFLSYELALAGVKDSANVEENDILFGARVAGPKTGSSRFAPRKNAGDSMEGRVQPTVCGHWVALANGDFKENDDLKFLNLIILNGKLFDERKEELRKNPDNKEKFADFARMINGVLGDNGLSDETSYLFVHLGNAGNAANVAEVEQSLQRLNEELVNKKQGGFKSVQCLSSKRSEIFSLEYGAVRLPKSSAEVEELRGRIELSGNVEGFLTAFSLRCSTFYDGCEMAPVQWVRSWLPNLPKGELKHAKNWLDDLKLRLPEEDADRAVIALAGELLGYLLLERSEADEKELDNRLDEAGFRNIAIAVGKVLQKGR